MKLYSMLFRHRYPFTLDLLSFYGFATSKKDHPIVKNVRRTFIV